MKLEEMKWYRLAVMKPLFPYTIWFSQQHLHQGLREEDPARGDLYPLMEKEGSFTELNDGGWGIRNEGTDPAFITRLFGAFFPYSWVQISGFPGGGEIGLSVYQKEKDGSVIRTDILLLEEGEENFQQLIVVRKHEKGQLTEIGRKKIPEAGQQNSFEVGFRTGGGIRKEENEAWIDIMISDFNGRKVLFTVSAPWLYPAGLASENHRFKLAAYLGTSSEDPRRHPENHYMASALYPALAFADIRPIREKNGKVLVANGRIFFSASARMAEGSYQMILSWRPGTMDFDTEGALFFDYGDGRYHGDVASSILYDRENEEYLLWNCAFSEGHILAYGRTKADLLHGIHRVPMQLMEKREGADVCDFSQRFGDEDPDFYYDSERKKWVLAVCRLNGEEPELYQYYRFESEDPFTAYRFVEKTNGLHETGGSFVLTKEGRYFVSGADGGKKSCYYIRPAEDFSVQKEAVLDYPDGGFRGWGTVIPVDEAAGEKLYWLTFDRALSSEYNWSYGNLYLFEGGPMDI